MKIKHIATLNFCVFVSSRLLTWAKRVSRIPPRVPLALFGFQNPWAILSKPLLRMNSPNLTKTAILFLGWGRIEPSYRDSSPVSDH